MGVPLSKKVHVPATALMNHNTLALEQVDVKLKFTYNRPVIKPDGSMATQERTLEVPLISLVPLPAFTMDEVTVDFNMEVKDMQMSDSKTHTDVSSTVKYNSWFGLDASITGNVSSDTERKRQTDSTATYTIHARAV